MFESLFKTTIVLPEAKQGESVIEAGRIMEARRRGGRAGVDPNAIVKANWWPGNDWRVDNVAKDIWKYGKEWGVYVVRRGNGRPIFRLN